MNFKPTFFYILICLLITNCKEQSNNDVETSHEQIHGRKNISSYDAKQSDLYYTLKTKDSIMFELSYNQLDTSILKDITTKDVEFYHDQGGATYTQEDFINGMKGLANLSYKARRELKKGSTEVFPMYKNGELYAAILRAEHSFYAKEPNDKPEYLTSTAKYTTMWILQDNQWKISRIYSFDHQAPQ